MAKAASHLHYLHIVPFTRLHLRDSKDLGRSHGEVERCGDKLVVPGLVESGEVVRRAMMSSQSTLVIKSAKKPKLTDPHTRHTRS
jgi:hypothetical protein